MAKSATILLGVEDKGVQQKLNQTARRFKSFNNTLRVEQKKTRDAQLALNKQLTGFGGSLALISPELSLVSAGATAAAGAITRMATATRVASGVMKTALVATGVGAIALAVVELALWVKRTEEGSRAWDVFTGTLDNLTGSFLDKLAQGDYTGAFSGLITELGDTIDKVRELVAVQKELEIVTLTSKAFDPLSRLLIRSKQAEFDAQGVIAKDTTRPTYERIAATRVQASLRSEIDALVQDLLADSLKTIGLQVEVLKKNQELGNVFADAYRLLAKGANEGRLPTNYEFLTSKSALVNFLHAKQSGDNYLARMM